MYRHPDAKITGEGTPTATGYLEVTVDGVLVHSKDNGDGTWTPRKRWKDLGSSQERQLKLGHRSTY